MIKANNIILLKVSAVLFPIDALCLQLSGRGQNKSNNSLITRAFPTHIFLVKGRPRLINFDSPEWPALLILGDCNQGSLHFD